MTKVLDYYFSFRSPYSYLSGPRTFALADRYDVEVRFHGVIPMIMRGQSVPRTKGLHTLRDAKREAKRLGLEFGRVHDPVGDGALRVLNVSEYAKDQGLVRPFVLAASRGIWAEAVEVASDRGLKSICDRVGLDWAGARAAVDDPAFTARVEANTQALLDHDHWGVPLFVLDGELFWGQDRVEDVERRLAQ